MYERNNSYIQLLSLLLLNAFVPSSQPAHVILIEPDTHGIEAAAGVMLINISRADDITLLSSNQP